MASIFGNIAGGTYKPDDALSLANAINKQLETPCIPDLSIPSRDTEAKTLQAMLFDCAKY